MIQENPSILQLFIISEEIVIQENPAILQLFILSEEIRTRELDIAAVCSVGKVGTLGHGITIQKYVSCLLYRKRQAQFVKNQPIKG